MKKPKYSCNPLRTMHKYYHMEDPWSCILLKPLIHLQKKKQPEDYNSNYWHNSQSVDPVSNCQIIFCWTLIGNRQLAHNFVRRRIYDLDPPSHKIAVIVSSHYYSSQVVLSEGLSKALTSHTDWFGVGISEHLDD